jgi:hypothetical protein
VNCFVVTVPKSIPGFAGVTAIEASVVVVEVPVPPPPLQLITSKEIRIKKAVYLISSVLTPCGIKAGV